MAVIHTEPRRGDINRRELARFAVFRGAKCACPRPSQKTLHRTSSVISCGRRGKNIRAFVLIRAESLLALHIFSYVVTHDLGFAPNPFGGLLTLATCKPQIRKHACKGDYIVGTGSVTTVGNDRLVYAGQVAKVVPIDDYGKLPKYEVKRPSTQGHWWYKCGDNIYFKVNGRWKQRQNPHHGLDVMVHDLSGRNVLVCKPFWYFGEAAIDIPPDLRDIIKRGPGHKRVKDETLVRRFLDWLASLPKGRNGMPAMSFHESRCTPPARPARCGAKQVRVLRKHKC